LQYLCPAGDSRLESGLEVRLDRQDGPYYVVLFRRSGQIHAYANVCPHQGRNLSWAPNRFLLETDGILVCPHHGAGFDVTTGKCISGPCQGSFLERMDIELREDGVWIRQETEAGDQQPDA